MSLPIRTLDVALVNSDGYWTRASDYYLFQEAGGKFHVVPYDINEAFQGAGGGPGRGGPGAGPGRDGTRLDPLVSLDDPYKPLRSKLLQVPSLRSKYMECVRTIADSPGEDGRAPGLRSFAELRREFLLTP